MPGPLDDNDYVETLAQNRGARGGGRGGQGPGPGGAFYGAPGFGGYGYGQGGGAYGANPLVRRRLVTGAAGPIPITTVGSSLGNPASPKALNTAAPTAGGLFGSRIGALAGRIGQRGGGSTPYSPAGELDEFQSQGDVRSLINYLLSQYQDAGSYGPGGSAAVMGGVADAAARASDQARQRAQLSADISGLDPAAAAALRLRTDLNSNTASQRAQSDAALQQLLLRQQFGDNALMTALAHAYGWDRGQQGFDFQNALQSQMRGGGLGQLLGGVAGGFLPILPGLFGGGGSFTGGGMGRSTYTTPMMR